MASAFAWPFSTKDATQYQRVDQGWDLQTVAGGPVFAVASGTLHKAAADPGGFGNDYPYEVLDRQEGGTTSDTIYYGHIHMLAILDGIHVVQGQLIGYTSKVANENGSASEAGWLEIGFALHGTGAPANSGAGATGAGLSMQGMLINADVGAGIVTGAQTGSGATGTAASTTPQNALSDPAKVYTALTGGDNIPDPRDNRPFSTFFFSSGNLLFNTPWDPTPLSPGREMVHGGMAEITPRKGGSLACYFMLNPTSISTGYSFSAEAPLQSVQSPELVAIAALPLSNVSINFSLIFNRMYEVWKGDFPGPSDIGVRWDIRSLERLTGILDDSKNNGGVSRFGPGHGSPVGQPIQVVFGGINSFQFQGIIQGLNSTYTRFSRDMIPTEATVDIQMLYTYIDNQTPDLSKNLLINFPSGTSISPIPSVLFP